MDITGIIQCVAILDDFIFVSQSESECCNYLHQCQTVADCVGIPVKHSETVQSATCVTVHGIEVDTNVMQVRLPGQNWLGK